MISTHVTGRFFALLSYCFLFLLVRISIEFSPSPIDSFHLDKSFGNNLPFSEFDTNTRFKNSESYRQSTTAHCFRVCFSNFFYFLLIMFFFDLPSKYFALYRYLIITHHLNHISFFGKQHSLMYFYLFHLCMHRTPFLFFPFLL